jgi:uncharacterized protein YkwD
MLSLLNEARRAAGLAPMALDAELSAVALAHTQEMSAARFFGHQSPTTGRVEDRLRRAGVSVMKLGENISQGDTAEIAHRALMDSPGHRANMLDPAFTHVGIGAVLRTTERPALLVTMVFARRPRIPAAAVTSAVASELVSSRRRARGLAPLKVDQSMQRAAEAGLQVVLKASGPAVPDPALDAAHAALVSEARRLGHPVPKVCGQLAQVVDLEQLDENPILSDPALGRIGLAAAARKDGATIFVLTLAESSACK